jgi:hypothetical protein
MLPPQQTLEDTKDIVCPAYNVLRAIDVTSGMLHRVTPERVHDDRE